jgi:1-aminocyclopropane-1-carboxylate deaminase/D-cysteine desulfhydrase-like pyridoxal-dependent ACC family enzyme
MAVDLSKIDCPARAAARAEHVEPGRPRECWHQQEKALGFAFDYMIVCTVTGSTHAGMLVGFTKDGRARRVIGIDASATPKQTAPCGLSRGGASLQTGMTLIALEKIGFILRKYNLKEYD